MTTTTFARISADPAFQELFKASRHREYARNGVILHESAPPECLYLLVSGLVGVRYSGVRGKELLLAYLYPGDFFGEMCLFPGQEARTATIRAAAPSVVLEIAYDTFLALTARYSSLWLELAGQLSARLRSTNHRLAEMPVLHAADRIWLALNELAANSDEKMLPEGRPIHLTRQDLGKLTGCSRELAGMVLKDFAAAGRIVLRGKTIIVPVPARSPE